ncbi:MAG: D-alanyl-D-alanine carboxypeptidase [Oscillospiraceae bacterium]|nr:D-alanyl-D-alanine carboxypeptidase [Oscillospiraceae bacterium]MCL2278029.1 D-alanyl-D-alanine carboxypeptidase [Oscillospiraceae bacterium]
MSKINRVFRTTAALLLMVFFLQLIPAAPATALTPFTNIAAEAAILVESETGQILFSHNAFSRHPADDLTKIMTLYLAARAVENDEISDSEFVEMTEAAWLDIDERSSTLDILPGEVMTFIDLIYSSYVGNANEASNMIALRLAGSIDSFVRQMNAMATEIGATNTNFVNPHGQHSPNQFTTAYDMFLIYSHASRSMLFNEVSSTFRHTTETIDEFESRTFTTSNSLIVPGSIYFYRHALSGKDSATFEGGHSLVASAEENNMFLISVILGSYVEMFEDGSADIKSLSETQRLFHWGYNEFAWREILRTTDLLDRVPVLHGSGTDFVNARPSESLTVLIANSVHTDAFERRVRLFYDEDNPIEAPVEAGHLLGEVTIRRDGNEYARISLVANTSVDLSGIEYIRIQVMEMLTSTMARNIIIILVLLVLLYIALVVRHNVVRAKRRRRMRSAKQDLIQDRQRNFRG